MEKLFDLINPLQEKRLEDLVKAIVDKYKPLKILCFSTNLRIDAALSCFSVAKVTESFDFELLTVTDKPGCTEKEMQEFTSSLYRNGKVMILDLKKDDMKTALESKNIYITTILEKGTTLYIADGFENLLIK